MAKAKGLSFLNSLQLCRPKDPSSMIKNPLSPLNSKPLDISFPSSTSMQPRNEQKVYNTPLSSSDSDNDDYEKEDHVVRKIGSSSTSTQKQKKQRDKRSAKEKSMMNESSYVVVKRSVDPKEDFKKSMLEMIVEKQMFDPRELEHLLLRFLSLNSRLHHRVIIEAFTDILKQVFSA